MLDASDPELHSRLTEHASLRRNSIDMMAGGSIPTSATKEALGRMELTRGVEGRAGKRYISCGGAVDEIEGLAVRRAMRVFGVEHANVQIASGTQANNAALQCACEPGNTVLAMSLTHGGHLSHTHPKSYCGLRCNVVTYGVVEGSHAVDYDSIWRLASQFRPRVIIAGASSYPRMLDYEALMSIAAQVDAMLLLDISHYAGFVACGLARIPVAPHVILTSTTYKTLCGPRGALIGCSGRIANDLERAIFPGVQGSVAMGNIAAKAAVLGEVDGLQYRNFQVSVLANAQRMVEVFKDANIPMVAGGTDTHMVVVDLRTCGRSGLRVEAELFELGIIVNRQMVPYDPLFPGGMSGLRFGVTTVTIRQIQENELRLVSRVVAELIARGDVRESLRRDIRLLARDLSDRPLHPVFVLTRDDGGRKASCALAEDGTVDGCV